MEERARNRKNSGSDADDTETGKETGKEVTERYLKRQLIFL